ncbi:alpha/beta-hydrolase [Teratosphaeria nubilosa]|uniref:Carboxylic ester hydrolase n=1 Tax=Teratosphaeria nubilosa TaxID=161662 RepID=A0A6G1L9M0_9PEZI|nr:alpha/beta-hydrolase [Teratosphaeria nubilosa]
MEPKLNRKPSSSVAGPDLTYSETQCLNLNTTVPLANDLKYLPDDRRLPVLVFIDGSGLITGSANWPQYDLAHIAKLGASRGRPFIAVGVNYRPDGTGVSYSDRWHDAELLPNNGLRDQRAALLWIKRYITGFGGDAENVTLAGHSTGAASVSYHMRSKEPLFRRAIFMCGLCLAVRPPTQEEANTHHDATISRSSLALDTPARRNQVWLSGDIYPTSRPNSPSEQERGTGPALPRAKGTDLLPPLIPKDVQTSIDSQRLNGAEAS